MTGDELHELSVRRVGHDHFVLGAHGDDVGLAEFTEPLTGLPAGRRVYIFNPRGWSEGSARKIIEEVQKWQLPQ